MMYYRKPGMRLVLLLFLLSASLRAKKVHGALLNVVASTTSERRDDESAIGAGPLEPLIGSLRAKYRGLTPNGKFIAMAATGFIGSRLVMDVAATSLKVAGAVFIVYVSESTADLHLPPARIHSQFSYFLAPRSCTTRGCWTSCRH
jgi:hypothetical protein